MKSEQLLQANKTLNKTFRATMTTNTKKTNFSLTEKLNSPTKKRNAKSKKTKFSNSLRRGTFNYQSFLDENTFVPKHKDLKKIINECTSGISKVVFDLATSTKQTNEKIKEIISTK